MRKRDIRALRQAKPERWASPDPEPDEWEGDTPDLEPLDLWPQELAEQQEQQR